MQFICEKCGALYPDEGMPYLCQKCNSQYIPDLNSLRIEKNSFLDRKKKGFWEYKFAFGLFETAEIIDLGEGNTPLIEYYISNKKIHLKMESLNPTGSYKDRNSALLISQMKARKIMEFVEDSSGNAGASIAAYAARANISANIFVPSYASGPKIKQIKSYGAKLNLIEGSRQNTTNALFEFLNSGLTYASHAFMPFGIPGIATISYELFNDLGDAIDIIFAPVGHGGLMYGLIWGFEVLLKNKIISKMPYFIGVQSDNCSPFINDIDNNKNNAGKIYSIAEGILINNPSKFKLLQRYVKKGYLEFISVSENEIKIAHQEICEDGILIEETSAVVIAAIKKYQNKSIRNCIAIITGNGLKSI